VQSVEIAVNCPFCGEEITVVVDISVDGEQSYVEDCFVCCRPIQFRVECREGELVSIRADRA
jgi:hypothetical protein